MTRSIAFQPVHTDGPDPASASGLMDALAVHDRLPLGTVLRYFDGTPRPPERFNRKLRAWERRNGGGRLVRKSAPRPLGLATLPADFTLHEGDFGTGETIVITVRRIIQVTTELRFSVVNLPQPGMIRVLTRFRDCDELRFLARDMAQAEAWMRRNHQSNLVTEIVGDDELPVQLGRAA